MLRASILPAIGAAIIAFFIAAILLFFLTAGAQAQNGAPENAREQLRQYSQTLDRIERALDREKTTDDELAERRTEALWTAVQVRELALRIDAQADRIGARVAQLVPDDAALGGAPAEPAPNNSTPQNGTSASDTVNIPAQANSDAPSTSAAEQGTSEGATPEASVGDAEIGETSETDVQSQVANTSALLEARLGQLMAMIRQAKDIEVRAEQLAEDATKIIRSRFGERVFKHHASILSPQLWQTFFVEFSDGLTRTELAVNLVTKAALSRGMLIVFPFAIFLLLLGFLHVPYARKKTGRWICRASRQKTPSDTGVAIVALVSAVVMTAVPLIGLWIVFNLIEVLELDSIPLTGMEPAITGAVVFVAASHALSLAILTPERPAWRVAPISSAAARRYSKGLQVPTQIVALGMIFQGLNRVTDQPHSVQYVFAGILSLMTAISVLVLIKGFRRRSPRDETAAAQSDERKAGQSLMDLMGILASVTAIIILGAIITGFLPLAWFLTKQLIWTVLIVATVFLVAYFLDAISTKQFAKDGRSTARLATLTGLRNGLIAQAAILITGLFKLLVGLAGLIAISVPWGLNSASFVDQIEAFFTGFNIGDLRVSLVDILIALVILSSGIALTRLFQSWLTRRYLPNTSMDEGLKNSLTTATGYVGLIIAIVVAFSTIGINLSRLALVAGALSVGIGFGLQSIVNNFVSGLILLAERPIKAGDWIEVAGEQGIVKHISVRSTELQTFDRATVLIPNSDLISGTVKNRVFGNTLGRVTILVGISYDSDIEKARTILLEIAKNHQLTLSYPAPNVLFLGFGDSALDMRLDIFVSDVSNSLTAHSDINFEILRAFREANIEIPFPQRDINIRATDEARELIERQAKSPIPKHGLPPSAETATDEPNDKST